MAYRMAPIPMTFSYLEGHFSCVKPFYSRTLEHIAHRTYDMFIDESESIHGL